LLARDLIDSAIFSSNFVGFLGARVRFTRLGKIFCGNLGGIGSGYKLL
jgi:hypothetical protein